LKLGANGATVCHADTDPRSAAANALLALTATSDTTASWSALLRMGAEANASPH